MNKALWLLAPIAGLMVSLAVACGGDGSGGAAAAVANEPLDLQAVVYKVETLQSFRFDLRMKLDFELGDGVGGEDDVGKAFGAALLGLLSDVRAEGAYVGPDRFHGKVTLAGQEVETIQIGDRAWIKEGGKWRETEPEMQLFSQSPTDLLGQFLPEGALKGAKVSKETVNGVKTTHYAYDKESLAALAQSLGENAAGLDELKKADFDLWLSEEGGIPVRIVMDLQGESDGQPVALQLEMNLREINSNSIKIEAPI